MKLFNDNTEDFHTYIEHALNNENVELECIFGSIHSQNPITKRIFLDLIHQCKENYNLMKETA